ncbi:MAG: hypothetical protein CL521_04920 [Actinobacteria bacterium]|nr:hypothetical protein [Actinomycetota bacterium]
MESEFSAHDFYSHFFPHHIQAIHHLSAQHIVAEKRPFFWPKHIPFTAGIDQTSKQAFIIYLSPLSKPKIAPIKHPLNNPVTICVSTQGQVAIIDTGIIHIFQASPFLNRLEFQFSQHLPNPTLCEINNQHLYIINGPDLYKYKLSAPQHPPQKTSLYLGKSPNIIDFNVLENNELYVLTKSHFHHLNEFSIPIRSYPLPIPYTQIQDNYHHGIYLLSPSKQQLDIRSQHFSLIEEIPLNSFNLTAVKKMILLPSFGLLGLYQHHKGAYFSLKTQINHARIHRQNSLSDRPQNELQFNLSMPSKININLLDEQKNLISTIISKEVLPAGPHFILIDTQDKHAHQLHISAKATYGNTSLNEIYIDL